MRKAARTNERLAAAIDTTFKSCAEKLVASREAGWRNAKHREQWRSTLRAYTYPALGGVRVRDIDTELVLRVLDPIWRVIPDTASRIRGRIEAVLNWAKARGLRDGQNPAQWRGHLDQLLPARAKVRRVQHFPALPYVEIPSFMAELRSRSGIAARALEYVILTAARAGEGLAAVWGEIDMEARMWIIPPERMKSGREHRVPLSSRALAILRELAEIRRGEFVFPGLYKQGRPLSDNALRRILRDMRPGITIHGFRSTLKDWCADTTDTPNVVSELALAHTVADKVEAAYRRGDLFEKRRLLMEAWSAYCARKPNALNVVPLKWRSR